LQIITKLQIETHTVVQVKTYQYCSRNASLTKQKYKTVNAKQRTQNNNLKMRSVIISPHKMPFFDSVTELQHQLGSVYVNKLGPLPYANSK